MMGRARLLGRAAALGAATFATLLATGTVGSAEAAQAAQAATPTASAAAPARITAHGDRESFTLPAGVDEVKVGTGGTHFTVTRSAGISPATSIPCTLTVSNPAYGGSAVSATAVIRCAYPTTLYLQVGLSYNGSAPVYNSQSFPSTYTASLTVSTSATPGYYQASAISVLGTGQQYGWTYSSNVYIPQ
jgi:hypothetical protein